MRVPLLHTEGRTAAIETVLSKRLPSEATTMEYVETHTKIPIPHLYSYNPRFDSAVGYPYLTMSKAHGVPLISLWGDMSDEHWREILREVVNILVELWSHRFDKAGVLFKREDIIGQGKVGWVVEAELVIGDLADVHVRHNLKSTSHPSAASYWMAYANALLVDIEANNFGAFLKNMGYARTWFLRSFILALFDPAEDAEGYPLCHGDMNEQNIMVNNTGVRPHITAIIDRELSGPTYVYSSAQCPLFIIDHPSLKFSEEDKRKRARNTKDQAVFDELILQAETKSSSSHMACSSPLSTLIAGSLGSHLFQQIAQFPMLME